MNATQNLDTQNSENTNLRPSLKELKLHISTAEERKNNPAVQEILAKAEAAAEAEIAEFIKRYGVPKEELDWDKVYKDYVKHRDKEMKSRYTPPKLNWRERREYRKAKRWVNKFEKHYMPKHHKKRDL